MLTETLPDAWRRNSPQRHYIHTKKKNDAWQQTPRRRTHGRTLTDLPHERFQVPPGAKIHEEIEMATVLRSHANSPPKQKQSGSGDIILRVYIYRSIYVEREGRSWSQINVTRSPLLLLRRLESTPSVPFFYDERCNRRGCRTTAAVHKHRHKHKHRYARSQNSGPIRYSMRLPAGAAAAAEQVKKKNQPGQQ